MKKLLFALVLGVVVACGGGNDVVVPDAIDAFVHCDPLNVNSCGDGMKCTWIIDQAQPRVGHIDCAPAGPVAANAACTYGPAGPLGYDNCVAGTVCNTGECKVICDQAEMNPLCPANYSCGLYENLLESSGATVAGVCDSNCDPLTQNTLATGAIACGSTDPANPNKGCYTSNGYRQFTCAPANNSPDMDMGVLWRTDDQFPLTNAQGQAYPNGCAPGYQAVFFEGPMTMIAKCTGLCAPRDTDMTKGDLRYGAGDPLAVAKLVTQAAPAAGGNATCKGGKKGSLQNNKQDGSTQNCLHMWQFLLDMGMTTENQYNDTLGVCFNFGEWTWDHDNNTQTAQVPTPSCTSLPKATKRTDPAARLGCYSLATWASLPPARYEDPTQLTAPAARRDFRLQYSTTVELVRHSYQ
ncbi:MAG: hypothetical protein WKG01_37600 [Kofleriaceae bacterium]